MKFSTLPGYFIFVCPVIALTLTTYAADSTPQICDKSNKDTICLALKYVVFEKKNNEPVVSEEEVFKNIKAINSIWKKCNMSFEVDEYLPVNPKDHHLRFNTLNNNELDEVRAPFQSDSDLLVVTTGKWDREGTLGNTKANAWTAMPGEDFYGAVLEAPVGTYPNIIAHELGHYLNLDHVKNKDNLMSRVIYDYSVGLTKVQCQQARKAAFQYWSHMMR